MQLVKKDRVLTLQDLRLTKKNRLLILEMKSDKATVQVLGKFDNDKFDGLGIKRRINDQKSEFYGLNIPKDFDINDRVQNVYDPLNNFYFTVYNTISYKLPEDVLIYEF